ncbi:uncharacterized protein LOC131957655 [Physella acuta]|uniref:uncharacterized protein LOC131957655 n=1 Tax=Physella acuta TaxID=109671 RepID=UPI0027DD4F6E|nr:uncharacterized protein LOC131957655 [Physella acuta]
MVSLILLVSALLPLVTVGQTLLQKTCSADNQATIQRDATAWIGGVISLNEKRSSDGGCGDSDGSMQGYEALRWVLDLLNKKNETIQTQWVDDYYVPGIRLGMKVRNYCNNQLTAVSSIGSIFPELSDDQASCSQAQTINLGIIGASRSGDTIELAEAAEGYKIPVVSYQATTPSLTLSGQHPNFMRTVSPDGPLMEVIVKVFKQLNWNYVAVVYDKGSYGSLGYKELHTRMVAAGICLTTAIMVDAYDSSTTTDTLNKIIGTNATGAVYVGPYSYAISLLLQGNAMKPDAGKIQWILTEFPLDYVFDSTSTYQRGVLFVSAASRYIAEFEDHWIRLNETNPSDENPWFSRWFEDSKNCKFNPTSSSQSNCNSIYAGMTATEKELLKRAKYQQDQYVEAAVMSVFTYARALRTAQKAKCPGVSGLCFALKNMTRETFYNDYLKKVNFTFTSDERVPTLASNNVPPYNAAKRLSFNSFGDISDPSYYIWNYNDIETGSGSSDFQFRRVGSHINGKLDFNLNNVGMYSNDRMTRLLPLPSSLCPSAGCNPCLGLPAELKYYYEPGSVVINGIFSLHNMGLTSLTCGAMKSANHFMYLEAMIYAIRQANANVTYSGKFKFGGLGMDDCSSSDLGQTYIAQVQRGNLKITDTTGNVLDPRTIEAYTAAHTTQLTLPLAEAMNMLLRPMVGYRAGGSELDDKSRYPYYLQAGPSTRDEIKAIIMMLKKLKWMYVQAVVSDLHYSVDALKLLRELGAKAGICVVATHNIGTTSDGVNAVINGLNANTATAPAVVLLEPEDSRRLLAGLSSNTALRRNIALIGTSRWGRDMSVVKGYEDIAEGLITLSVHSSTLDKFRAYLSDLNANNYTLNPWFKEWYMAAYNCTTVAQSGMSLCSFTSPITSGPNFNMLYEVENVINAVTAIAYGLDSTLRFYCGNSYQSICGAFLNSADKGARFLAEIKKVTFPIEDKSAPNTFKFVGGSGAVPFEINNFRSKNYQKVGDVDPWEKTLTLSTIKLYANADPVATMSMCPTPCLECLYMFYYLDYWYIPGDVVIGAIFDIHYSGNGPFSCADITLNNGAMYTEVFDFALKKINSGTESVRLRNVTLGGLAFDGCANPTRATAIVNLVHTGMPIMDASGNEFSSSQLVSWMTYDSQTTIDTAGLLQKLDMPIISPGATARALDNKNNFFTFFRTIPSDSVVVRGMANFANAMGWKYVIVLNAPDTSNRQSRDYFRELLASYGICVVASYEFVTDGSMGVILDSIMKADTQVVAVFAEPNRYIAEFLQAKSVNYYQAPLRFIANRPWGQVVKTGLTFNYQVQQSVFFDLPQFTVSAFTNFLSAKSVLSNSNPWFQEIYSAVFACNLPGSYKYVTDCNANRVIDSNSWSQDIWTLSTVNAIYAVAEGVHRTLVMKCGANYNGVCSNFTYGSDVHDLIMAQMDQESFTEIERAVFNFVVREANKTYSLMRYPSSGSPEMLGSLDGNGTLTLVDKTRLLSDYKAVKSACAGDCLVCSAANANLQDITLIPGDFYIVGLFDVHLPGATPFTCGAINPKHGLQLLEAFHFALEYVNNKTGYFKDKLPNVQLGGVGLDMCMSASRAANLVANIHSGNIVLKKNGITVDSRMIDAYIATMDTESSTRVADILTQLGIPQISYGATGMDLLDRTKYNYFLRSVPADDKQCRAIVSYLKKFLYNNIQVITSFDEIGEPGVKEFKRLSFVNKICITKEYLVGEGGNVAADAPGVIKSIGARKDAQVVVLWMKDPLPLLEAASSDDTISSTFLFIATDKWGADADYLANPKLFNLLKYRNLVILDVETADVPDYDRYLEFKTPSNYLANPWFKDFFENLQNCYWDSPSGTRLVKCDPSSTIPRADNYVQDSYVLYVINAVFSAAMGIHNAIKSVCTSNTGACNLYVTSGERRQKVLTGILNVNFTDDTHQPFYYTEDGQSSRGFHVYNVTYTADANKLTQSDFRYQNVGSYNDTHFLKLDITYETRFSASCDAPRTDSNVADCVCLFPTDLPSRFMKKDDGGRGLSVVYIGDVHQPHPTNPLACGAINTGVELQKLLAFFYAVDRINTNSNQNLPDYIRLDGLALDSCTHALRLGQDVYNVLSGNQLCDSDDYGLLIPPASIVAFVIDKDSNTLPVSSMLLQEKITSISPTAGSALLSDRILYPYFLRTRGDNLLTAQIILNVAQQAKWDYLSVLYSDSLAYQGAKESLLDSSEDLGACVGDAVPLPMNATLADAELALNRISQQVGARGVVLFVEPNHLKLLMQATQSLGLTGRFVWVLPYDFTTDPNFLLGYEQELAGSLIIEPRSAFVDDFKRYLKNNLSYKNKAVSKIPSDWFQEIYETLHQCNILDIEKPSVMKYSKICTGDEDISDAMIPQDPSILHVIISVYSIAFGLTRVDECKAATLDIAACLQLLPNRNDLIYQGISGVYFRVLPELLGDQSFFFQFDQNENGNAGYVIKNYQVSPVAPNPYIAREIGTYTTKGLDINLGQYAAGNLYSRGSVPASLCAAGTVCTCQLTSDRSWKYQPVSISDPDSVKVGGIYIDPATNQQVKVESVPAIGDRFPQAWAIILSVLAALGAAISLGIFIYLLIMYPVRGGTSILGYILSFGIIFLYLMVFPFIAHAEERMCGLRRFGLGLVYAIVYSALMVKLVDCWRVRGKDDTYSAKYSKLGRPVGLFLVTVFFVLVQVIINTEWLILEPPTVTRIFYNNQYWPRCSPDDFYDEGLVLSLVYIMVIIFFSLIVGLLSYSSSKNHREARWILGILILSVPCWVIWCSVSIIGAIKVRDAAVCVGLLVNATVMLVMVPVRKLYLLHTYNAMIEVEEEQADTRSHLNGSHKGGDHSSVVYGRQYDNNPRLHDRDSQLYSKGDF